MNLGIKGRTAIVVAASKGLGKAAALELAREGANLVICSRDEQRIQSVGKEISLETRAQVRSIVADVTRVVDIRRVVREAVEGTGRVDILVTNAGGPPVGGFADHDDTAFLNAFEQNCLSAIRLIRECLPHMKAQKWGRIVNITSLSVKEPVVNLMLSNVARLGLVGVVKTLSREVAGDNILISNVAPTSIFTERTKELVACQAKQEGRPYEEVLATREKKIPVGRFGRPDELAALIAFLVSNRNGYITGVTIPVDGGVSHSAL
jgi:3-oxoacyl-[acyl-carrier protein] reductase